MRYRGSLTVPANTLAASPVSATVGLTYGRIEQVSILFPAGPSGLVNLIVLYHERQIFPTSPEQTFIGDDHLITFPESFPIHDLPFDVVLVGWSPGSTLSHAVYVDFSVEPEVEIATAYKSAVALPGGIA